MRIATLHTGALHESTLAYAIRSVCAARALARSWAADVVSVVVYWNVGPALPAGWCADFDHAQTLPWNAAAPGATVTDRHQRNAWTALRRAVDAGLGLGAAWMFRVRFDAHVEAFPVAPTAHWSADCLYTFRQAWGLPSDNVDLFPARAGRVLFDPDLPDPLGEHALVVAAAKAELRFCWVRANVWLLKPERAVLGAGNGSVGVRHWTPPPHPLGVVSQPAAGFDPGKYARDRARHASWPTYAQAPLPRFVNR